MMIRRNLALAVTLALVLAVNHSAALAAAPPDRAASDQDPNAAATDRLVAEIDGIVRQHFYAPQVLERVNWNAATDRARAALAEAADPMNRSTILNDWLATLQTSHTNHYSRDNPAYWQLAAIFEPYLGRSCPDERIPTLPITVSDIGVFWKRIDSKWFVGGVYANGPADAAGLKLGDEIVRANGQSFSPVLAFAGKPDVPVTLEVRRRRGGPLINVIVTPQATKPHETLKSAAENSWRIIQRGSRRIAYLHVWSWTSIEIQHVVQQAITKSNQASVDGFVLDLRDGWGGASPHYLAIFNRDVPLLEGIDRAGAVSTFDAQIRKPAAVLINGGTRSGKEIIAYGAKQHRFAQLVGERTAGAVVSGQPFCLSDGSLLFLAVADVRVDGGRLEGVGVAPDVEVPFNLPYAAGEDPQLERALDLLAPKS